MQKISWVFLALFTLAGCTSPGPVRAKGGKGPLVILVHGVFQHRNVWNKVVEQLEEQGARALAIDLPGQGSDGMAFKEVSFFAYVKKVKMIIRGQKQKVILVGLDFNGVTISRVAEEIPERIEKLVYVAAYLPKSGQSMNSCTTADEGSFLTRKNFLTEPTEGTASLAKKDLVPLYAEGAFEEIQSDASDQYETTALFPMASPVNLTPSRFGSVKKVYIYASQDKFVSFKFQEAMTKETPIAASFIIDGPHALYLTDPTVVANRILKL